MTCGCENKEGLYNRSQEQDLNSGWRPNETAMADSDETTTKLEADDIIEDSTVAPIVLLPVNKGSSLGTQTVQTPRSLSTQTVQSPRSLSTQTVQSPRSFSNDFSNETVFDEQSMSGKSKSLANTIPGVVIPLPSSTTSPSSPRRSLSQRMSPTTMTQSVEPRSVLSSSNAGGNNSIGALTPLPVRNSITPPRSVPQSMGQSSRQISAPYVAGSSPSSSSYAVGSSPSSGPYFTQLPTTSSAGSSVSSSPRSSIITPLQSASAGSSVSSSVGSSPRSSVNTPLQSASAALAGSSPRSSIITPSSNNSPSYSQSYSQRPASMSPRSLSSSRAASSTASSSVIPASYVPRLSNSNIDSASSYNSYGSSLSSSRLPSNSLSSAQSIAL